MRTPVALVLALGATACGQAPPVVQVPVPTLPSNGLPTVTLSATSCHPRRDQPCTATFTATASDPDGDALTFIWSGCVSPPSSGDVVRLGTAVATCAVTQPGALSATVEVTDVKGGSALATASAQGVNEAPHIWLDDDGVLFENKLRVNRISHISGKVADAEQDGEAMAICRDVAVTVSGPCRGGRVYCAGPDQYGFDGRSWSGARWGVTLTGGPAPGTCAIDVRARDSWEAATVVQVRVSVE